MSDQHKSYRAISRKDYGQTGVMSIEQLNCGSLMRIADALELVAKGYENLLRDRDYYKQRTAETQEHNLHLSRTNSALRGYITRLKRGRR